MNEGMVERWNSVVKPEDTVFYLGDFSMGGADWDRFVRRLNGTKYLIAGNHDKVFPSFRPKHVKRYLDAGWEAVSKEMHISIDGHAVILSHFPYTLDHTADARFLAHRPVDRGQYLLHGHVHSPQKRSSLLEIHVGVDAWDYYPVSEEQIVGLLRGSEALGEPGLLDNAGRK